MAQIDAALYAQGTGAAGGYRGSTNGANLVISGSSNMTITIGNCVHGEGGICVWKQTAAIRRGGMGEQLERGERRDAGPGGADFSLGAHTDHSEARRPGFRT